jgi:hypothetical protein
MIRTEEEVIQIPSVWPRAIEALREIEAADGISTAQWQEIVNWLTSTEFDDRSFLAGEASALLLRDRAPSEIRAQLWQYAESPNDWLVHFCMIALENERDRRYRALLQRAAGSSLVIPRTSAEDRLRANA